MKMDGLGFGLPRSRIQNGHIMSGAIPALHTVSVSVNDIESRSDMDVSSDFEDEMYTGLYSLRSHGDLIPNGAAATRCVTSVHKIGKYGKDEKTAYLNSSTKPPWQKQGSGIGIAAEMVEGERLSGSATSTEISYGHCRSTNETTSRQGVGNLDGYASTATSQGKTQRWKSEPADRKPNLPSAPPMASATELELMAEKLSTTRDSGTFHSTFSVRTLDTDTPNVAEDTHTGIPDLSKRSASDKVPTISLPSRFPTFHASEQGPWVAVLSYDACVRLCLHAWAKGCTEEVSFFLNDECAVLRNAFCLRHVLLQSEEEVRTKNFSELVSEGTAPKSKRTIGKLKVQVRKVKMGLDPPVGCSFPSLDLTVAKLEASRKHLASLTSVLSSGWQSVRRVRVTPHVPPNGSFSRQSLAYMRASSQYIKEISRILRNEVSTLHNRPSSQETVQETFPCFLRLKSSLEEDSVRMLPGAGETLMFFPDNHNDDLIIEVQDSKGHCCGHVTAQIAAIADYPSDKLRWWPIYHEPEHELAGRVQLYINYSEDGKQPKCGSVAETVAYDFVLEVAMKVQHFQQRNLLLHGAWKWLVNEFASYYGVSDAYTKLRYLSYIMDVATPTKDCLDLVHDLLLPVLMKGNRKAVLSHQENRILGEVEDHIQQIIALVFENYKSLDELSPSGIMDVFGPASGLPAPALEPAVKLYSLLHDILSAEIQLKFCRYFQTAAKKRSRRHMVEMDEVINSNVGLLTDPVAVATLYQKMKSLILSMRNEIYTDMQIQDKHVLPSFLDLPNLCAAIYSTDLAIRLRKFLIAYPPPGPLPHVTELVVATADFQMDLSSWNIKPVKEGIDAKELFHTYITHWIKERRQSLLDLCKTDRVKCYGIGTQHSTTPFVDEMYEQLNMTLKEYEVIVSRWPEYAVILENAVVDVEKAIIEALERQYSDVLSPLKDGLTQKILGLKYVQKLSKRSGEVYFVSDELGIFLNSMKRMLDVLRPRIEYQLKSWTSYVPDGQSTGSGECFSEITVMLRSKFRTYLQAVAVKFVENTKMQNVTKLKSIMQNSKEIVIEADVQSRMQPLRDLLLKTTDALQPLLEPRVSIAICHGFWDRMGQEVLKFLQTKREALSSYKSSRIAVAILDDIFASQIQILHGNANLQEKDLEPPRSILEVHSILCKDTTNYQDNKYYY